jgi:hypothetical protein
VSAGRWWTGSSAGLEMFVNADGEETDALHEGFNGTGAGTKDA